MIHYRFLVLTQLYCILTSSIVALALQISNVVSDHSICMYSRNISSIVASVQPSGRSHVVLRSSLNSVISHSSHRGDVTSSMLARHVLTLCVSCGVWKRQQVLLRIIVASSKHSFFQRRRPNACCTSHWFKIFLALMDVHQTCIHDPRSLLVSSHLQLV